MPYTLAQLEAFVSSTAYDPQTASLIALGIPELPRLKGEQIAPGITRIRGNLCNVHGRYGPCDKAKSGKKPAKGRKPAAPKKTDAQRTAERDTKRSQNVASVGQRMADTDTGLSPSGVKALTAFATGQQPDSTQGAGLAQMGLAERASDGSYRMTPTGRAAVAAMQAGDYQRAVDAISRGTDASGKRTERTTAQQARQQAAAKRQADAQAKRVAAQAKREAAAKKPAKAAAGGSKKPEKPAAEKPLKVAMPKRVARGSAPSVGGVAGSSGNKKPIKQIAPASPTPPKAPAKQIAPALQEAAQALSDGKELSEDDTQSLIRNGLARIVKGELVLTAAGQRQTLKSFRVFKDAQGKYRWVTISSSAFRDRDKEIVSTKALQDDCDYADKTGNYGPLRWWHMPGVDIGDCDFNAMHGRTLIESGTFRNQFIAIAAAKAAPELEISLGFLHLPTEPDAHSVFHHIRRFERSLVPRGKASNLLTQFSVKENTPMIDTKVKEALDKLGSNPDAMAYLQEVLNSATAREKALEDQKVAYKADEPTELPDLTINGVTYKAFPPKSDDKDEKPTMGIDAVEVEQDAIEDMPVEVEEVDDTALTLSGGDISAISQAVIAAVMPEFQQIASQIMGGLDLEKKVAGHVQGLLQPFQQAQATKDASDAEKAEAITALQASLKSTQDQLNELLGLQPEVIQRPSESASTMINPWLLNDQQLLGAVKSQVPQDQQSGFSDLTEKMFGTLGQS